LQGFFWFSQVSQNESPENEVVGSSVLKIRGAANSEFDIHANPLSFQACQFNAPFINVHADDSAFSTHNLAHAKGDSANPASHIQTVRSWSQPTCQAGSWSSAI